VYLAKLYAAIVLATLERVASQATVPITRSAGAPVGGDLSLDNFEYQHGNTANLVRPARPCTERNSTVHIVQYLHIQAHAQPIHLCLAKRCVKPCEHCAEADLS
jgi:hypothetical protein